MSGMSGITSARRQLAELLEAAVAGTDVTVVDHVPEELPTPCLVLDAAEDYLDRADTFAEADWWLTLRVYALVDLADNAQATEDLEALLGAALPALAGSDWQLNGIGRPGPFHTTGWLAHGAAITVRNLTTLPSTTPATTPGETP